MTIQEILDSLPRKHIFGGGIYNEKSKHSEMSDNTEWMDIEAVEKAIKQAWNSALDLAAENISTTHNKL